MPLPPYIHTPLQDPGRYQTVYARHPGSAAAPTAGLHFTPALLERLRSRHQVVEVTLGVGLDTFRPVTVADLGDHPLHSEAYSVPAATAAAVDAARSERAPDRRRRHHHRARARDGVGRAASAARWQGARGS